MASSLSGKSTRLGRASKEHGLAILIVLAHFVLGVLYSVTIPLWESYDEWGHFAPMEYIATRYALPAPQRGESIEVLGVPRERGEISFVDQSHQPPLYYVLGALAIFWIDMSDDPPLVINPLLHLGGTSHEYAVLHDADEAFPYSGTILAVHVVRLVSVILSTATVLLTYQIARILFPAYREVAWSAMAVNAFWPQFLFMGSVVNNDIAVTLFSSLFLYFLSRLLRGSIQPRDLFMLSLALGLAFLSKRNAVALLPFYGLGVLLYFRYNTRDGKVTRKLLARIFSGLAVAVIVIGTWLVRQVSFNSLFEGAGLVSPTELASANLLEALTFFSRSLWAQFGWGGVWAESWMYTLYSAVSISAALGILLKLLKQRTQELWIIGILALFFASFVGLTLLRASGVPPLGRYALPGISALSLLLVVSWRELIPSRWGWLLIGSICLGFFVLSTSIPFRVIIPYYAPPPKVALDEVQARAHPLSFTLGREIELLGYELDRSTLRPGESSTITLYLRSLVPVEESHIMGVHLLAPDFKSYGMDNFFPGKGSYVDAEWRPGEIVKETARIRLLPDFPAPAYAQIQILLFDPEVGLLPVVTGEGTPLPNQAAIFGRIRVIPAVWPTYEIEDRRQYTVGKGISFEGFTLIGESRPSSTLELLLYWKSLERVSADYQVFVHLVDASGEIRAQADGPPREGFYPTSVWMPGDLVEDLHQLKLPENLEAGGYEIRIGMYLLDSGERLLIMDPQGQMSDFIRLGNPSIQ